MTSLFMNQISQTLFLRADRYLSPQTSAFISKSHNKAGGKGVWGVEDVGYYELLITDRIGDENNREHSQHIC